MKWWDWIPLSSFFEFQVVSQLFHSPLLPSRGSSVTESPANHFLSMSLATYLSIHPVHPSITFPSTYISMRTLVPSSIMRVYNPNRITFENSIKLLYKYKTLLFLSIPIILRHMLRFRLLFIIFLFSQRNLLLENLFFSFVQLTLSWT